MNITERLKAMVARHRAATEDYEKRHRGAAGYGYQGGYGDLANAHDNFADELEELLAECGPGLAEVRKWLVTRKEMAVSPMYQRASAEFLDDFDSRFGDQS